MSPAPVIKHPRQVMREAVVAMLSGRTSAGTRVYASRVKPLTSRLLPAIGVYTLKQSSDSGATAPRRYTHGVTLVVQAILELDDGLDDAMDALAQQVEDVLLSDPTWGGSVDDSVLTETEMYLVNDGRSDSGCLEIRFTAEFGTSHELAAPATLDDFRRAGSTWTAPGAPDDATPAQDLVVLQPDPPAPEPAPEEE